MEKKYRLLENDTKVVGGRTLYRIEALKDFANVKKGDKGGYIESEDNLSHIGNCWVYGEAYVYGDACVYDNAEVSGYAYVYGNALVHGSACVADNARVFGYAEVYGNAKVYGDARVCGNAHVYDNACVDGHACVNGHACVADKARVYGYADVCGYAEVRFTRDYVVLKNIWSSGRYFTYTRSNKMWKVGCFYGTGEELIAKAYRDSEVSGREYKRVVEYVEAMYADLEKDKSK